MSCSAYYYYSDKKYSLCTDQVQSSFGPTRSSLDDCVPRMNIINLRLMHKLFMLIDSKLEEKGLSPNGWKSAKKFIADLMTMDANLLVSPRELTQFLETKFSSIIETDGTFLLEEVELLCSRKSHFDVEPHERSIDHWWKSDQWKFTSIVKKKVVEKNMLSDHSSCDSCTVKTLRVCWNKPPILSKRETQRESSVRANK
jgi:hypothetical protein